ncbi:uncharacterized protein LOC127006680 [Eriocheir sinensis]|uniref:uncharacterized protein LOC127006680 n=1 Tax=Eriocheir sinensis TaxID=95602 RepID=UPI0021C60DBE|nr:uncharacterized protein LOC127006680 [Eriocheir sinensis]
MAEGPKCLEDARQEVGELYTVIFHYMFPVLIATGIVTNSLNLIVLTRPLMRVRTYRWLRALACVDLSLCVLTVPVCLTKGGITPLGSRSLAGYYAHFGWSLSIAAQILSFYLMGMFAFERFLAVCRHDLYPRSQTDSMYRNGVVTATIVVLLMYVPTMVVGTVDRVDKDWLPTDGYSKQHQWHAWYPAYAWLREIFSRLVPAVVITFCNVRITMRLRHLRSIQEGFGRGVPATRRERERRLVLLLFWFTALFYIFNAPVIVYYLGFLHTNQDHCGKHLASRLLTFAGISNLLQMMGNVSNFVLYFLISPEFHNILCSLLKCKSFNLAAGMRTVFLRAPKIASATTTITTSVSSSNPATSAATGETEDESPTQSDSGYQQDVVGSITPPRGNSYSSGDEGRGVGGGGCV